MNDILYQYELYEYLYNNRLNYILLEVIKIIIIQSPFSTILEEYLLLKDYNVNHSCNKSYYTIII